jgi:hypothetical protein
MVNIPNYEKKDSYSFGDVSFLDCSISRSALGKALSVIDKNDLEFLRTYTPPSDKGFVWTPKHQKPAHLKDIEDRVGNSDGHSGTSFGWTMRALEAIAKEGWVTYYQKFLDEQ